MARRSVLVLLALLMAALMLSGCLGGGIITYGRSVYGWVQIDENTGHVLTASQPSQNQEPLVGATVSITGGGSDTTDANGYFEILNVRSGLQTVTVTHPAIRDYKVTVRVIADADTPVVSQGDIFVGVGYYIFIGVDDFQDPNIPRTVIGEFDAEDMYEALSEGSFLAGYDKKLIGSAATKINIRNAIQEAVSLAKPSDYLVIYYSGRGGGGSDEFYGDHIYPYDAVEYGANPIMINDTDLEQWTRHFPGTDITVILESGSSISFADGTPRPLALRKNNYTVMAAAREGHDSIYDSTWLNSAYTTFLLEGLLSTKTGSSYRRADSNNDRTITAKELHDYAYAQMLNEFGSEGPLPALWQGPSGNVVLFRY